MSSIRSQSRYLKLRPRVRAPPLWPKRSPESWAGRRWRPPGTASERSVLCLIGKHLQNTLAHRSLSTGFMLHVWIFLLAVSKNCWTWSKGPLSHKELPVTYLLVPKKLTHHWFPASLLHNTNMHDRTMALYWCVFPAWCLHPNLPEFNLKANSTNRAILWALCGENLSDITSLVNLPSLFNITHTVRTTE